MLACIMVHLFEFGDDDQGYKMFCTLLHTFLYFYIYTCIIRVFNSEHYVCFR